MCADKPRIMKKLRKINYNDIFGNNFSAQKIDQHFKNLENQEKVKVIGNVMDYLFQDLNALKRKQIVED